MVLLGVAGAWGAAPSGGEVINKILLRVNSRIATLEDYERTLQDRRRAILAAEMEPAERQEQLEESGRMVFRDLYEELLLLSRADQMGLQVSEAELDQSVQQTRQRMGLDSQEEFLQALEASGMTEAVLRDRLRKNMLVQQVVGREVQSRIQLEEEELRRVYRQRPELFRVPEALRIQEIIILSDAVPQPGERQAVAREILAELAEGASLAEVAAARSETGQTTGVLDLGWVERGDLASELETAAWELEAGSFSEPVEARGGLHLLQVSERRPEALRPFEEVRDRLGMWEMERRMAEEMPRYLEELASRSWVVMRVPPEAEGFRGFEQRDPEDTALDETAGLGSG